MRAINNPMTVFQDMSQGIVSPEGVEVLRELYPAIYAKFYEVSLEYIAGNKMSRNVKMKLKAALGITSGDVLLKQMAFQEPSAPKPRPKSGRKMAEGAVKRTINAERTVLQGEDL